MNNLKEEKTYKDIFKSESKNIYELFSEGNCHYSIPNYQRQYSWVDNQLDDLWNDLYNSFLDNQTCYFLGSVIVVDKGEKTFDIIDGQQRITTLTIMLFVLLKDIVGKCDRNNEVIDAIKEMLYFTDGYNNNDLRLLSNPEYDAGFFEDITSLNTFSNIRVPSKEDLGKSDPKYKYMLAVKYFYDKFAELLDDEPDECLEFIKYILYKTCVIKTVCDNQDFAIKLFLILNNRGEDLTNSDIIKSMIYGKAEASNQIGHNISILDKLWGDIEKICSDNYIKVDHFLTYYQNYELAMPSTKSLIDEYEMFIKRFGSNGLCNNMKKVAEKIDSLLLSQDKCLKSLRYLDWNSLIYPNLIALYSNEDNDYINSVVRLLRKLYYVSWIGGKTFTGAKNISFDILKLIKNKEPVDKIEEEINNFLYSNKLISKFYESLSSDIYGMSYLKPLMFSLEYEEKEDVGTSFYSIDNKIHMDHILPRGFYANAREWPNIKNDEETFSHINKLGNMALLSGTKNIEALNYGFDRKMEIYSGNDVKKSGKNPFVTTQKIIDDYNRQLITTWGIKEIEERQETLIKSIENMLGVSESDKLKEVLYKANYENVRSNLSRVEYNGKNYSKAGAVRAIIVDYINANNIKDSNDLNQKDLFQGGALPYLSNEKMCNGYNYHELRGIPFKLYCRTVFNEDGFKEFIDCFNKYYSIKDKVKIIK